MESDNENLVTEAEIERLRDIFDRDRRIETDDDLLKLAEIVNVEDN